MDIKITLGSNINQKNNIDVARRMLAEIFPDIRFSESVWTEAVGIESDRFLNCIAVFDSNLSESELIARFKAIEYELDDSHENHSLGTVIIDIDLISMGNRQIRQIIWE